MTEKQKRFVEEYLIDLNATAAARRAGYSEKNAHKIGPELLGKTSISAAIQKRMKAREKRVNITQDYVLKNLTEIVERCMQRAPVLNMKGEQVQDDEGNNLWAFNDRGANKALEMLGKHLGMFKDKIEHSGGMSLDLTAAIHAEVLRQAAEERAHDGD